MGIRLSGRVMERFWLCHVLAGDCDELAVRLLRKVSDGEPGSGRRVVNFRFVKSVSRVKGF